MPIDFSHLESHTYTRYLRDFYSKWSDERPLHIRAKEYELQFTSYR
jgi:hypothetical protein